MKLENWQFGLLIAAIVFLTYLVIINSQAAKAAADAAQDLQKDNVEQEQQIQALAQAANVSAEEVKQLKENTAYSGYYPQSLYHRYWNPFWGTGLRFRHRRRRPRP